MEHEERITELETRLAFQEQTIAQLDEVLCRQQDSIDGLIALCRRLNERLEEVAPAENAPADEAPPHY